MARGTSESRWKSFRSGARTVRLWYSGPRFRGRRQTGGLVSSVSHTLCCNSWQSVSSAACRSGAWVAKIGKDTSQRRRIINHMRKGETKSNTRQLLHLLTRSGRSLPQYFIILQGDKVFITTPQLCVFAFFTVMGQVSAAGKGWRGHWSNPVSTIWTKTGVHTKNVFSHEIFVPLDVWAACGNLRLLSVPPKSCHKKVVDPQSFQIKTILTLTCERKKRMKHRWMFCSYWGGAGLTLEKMLHTDKTSQICNSCDFSELCLAN